MFKELDNKIIASTEDKDKLEAAVFKAADLQVMLSEKIALISHTLMTNSDLNPTDPAAATTQTIAPLLPGTTSPPQSRSQKNQPVQQKSDTYHVKHTSNTNTDSSVHQPVADPSITHNSDGLPQPLIKHMVLQHAVRLPMHITLIPTSLSWRFQSLLENHLTGSHSGTTLQLQLILTCTSQEFRSSAI